MASAPTTAETDEDCCVLCRVRYNRTRSSLCQCKHCGQPLCFQCMGEHHNELLQKIDQLSHTYNGILLMVETKSSMIDDEAKNSIGCINQWFESYVKDVCDAKEKIIENIHQAKEDAKVFSKYVDGILTPFSLDLCIRS